MVVTLDYESTNKMIIPVPTLAEGMVNKKLIVNRKAAQRSVWTPTIALVMQTVKPRLFSETDANGALIGLKAIRDYQLSFFVLDSFTQVHLVKISELPGYNDSNTIVRFVVRNDKGEEVRTLSRNYDYSIYNSASGKYVDPKDHSKGANSYVTPKNDDMKNGSALTKLVANERTFNTLMKRYGISIDPSSHRQALIDSSLGEIGKFSSNYLG